MFIICFTVNWSWFNGLTGTPRAFRINPQESLATCRLEWNWIMWATLHLWLWTMFCGQVQNSHLGTAEVQSRPMRGGSHKHVPCGALEPFKPRIKLPLMPRNPKKKIVDVWLISFCCIGWTHQMTRSSIDLHPTMRIRQPYLQKYGLASWCFRYILPSFICLLSCWHLEIYILGRMVWKELRIVASMRRWTISRFMIEDETLQCGW